MYNPNQPKPVTTTKIILHDDGTYSRIDMSKLYDVPKSQFTDTGEMILNGQLYREKSGGIEGGSPKFPRGHGQFFDPGVGGKVLVPDKHENPNMILNTEERRITIPILSSESLYINDEPLFKNKGKDGIFEIRTAGPE